MEYLMIGLLTFSLLLFIISNFLKDPFKKIQEEIDQLSMQQIQDMYIIKKKLKILEEELLVHDDQNYKTSPSLSNKRKDIHEIIKNQVRSLQQQGLTIEQIARQSSLTASDVEWILAEKMGR